MAFDSFVYDLKRMEEWETYQRFFTRICPLWDFAWNPLPILSRAVNAIKLVSVRFVPVWSARRFKSKT
jgi:hypothetical protein